MHHVMSDRVASSMEHGCIDRDIVTHNDVQVLDCCDRGRQDSVKEDLSRVLETPGFGDADHEGIGGEEGGSNFVGRLLAREEEAAGRD